MVNLVELRNLVRIHGKGESAVHAVNGLDLDIPRGEFLAVVGVSGSGKSTLLHLIGALDTASSGSIKVDGRELARLTSFERAVYRRTTVGFVFQSFHLVASMTAQANVALALTFQGVFGAEREARTAEAIQRVGLSHRARHRPTEMSGGEQQRVALARGLVHRPLLLLADEPTGNLDRRMAVEIIDLMRSLNRDQGTTVIMVTHDEENARRAADRIIRLRDGKIVGEEMQCASGN